MATINYPKVYQKSDDALLGVLNNILKETAQTSREINSFYTFKFQAHSEELKSTHINKDNYVITENNSFDIKYIEDSHDDLNRHIYNVECEHVFYRLSTADLTYTSYAYTGTATEILTDLLSGTDFSVGTVDFVGSMTLAINEEVTTQDAIITLAEALDGEVDFSDDGFTIDILDTVGADNDFHIRLAKNLKGVTRIIDDRQETTLTAYKVDFIELKNSEEYIQKDLADLETIGVGDTVQVVDSVMSLDTSQRILKYTRNPVYAKNITVELANNIEFFYDAYVNNEQNNLVKGQVYNGIQLSPEDGLIMTLSDDSARAIFDATQLKFQVEDGVGGWEDALYFDPVSGTYKFEGTVEATDFIGGTINIGSGTFQVDNSGNCTANSITIGGGSGIANLSDAGALAILDTVNGTYIDNNSISTPKIQANAVTANEISVATLSAIAANLGTVTAGTLQGATIKTAATGSERIEMTSTLFAGYNASNQQHGVSIGTGDSFQYITFYNAGSGHASIGIATGIPGDNLKIRCDDGIQILSNVAGSDMGDGDILIAGSDDVTLESGDDIYLDPTGTAYYDDGSTDEEIATRGWVATNYAGDITAVTAGTGISGGGASGNVTVSLDTTYTDGRYAFYDTFQTCIGAGTGGSKTIDYINATGTGLVVWFTDSTNETILYD
jgi:hypothetical protein